MIPIKNEELLKNENITIDYYKNEFNTFLKKGNNIKEKIEKEIGLIDNLYDKINDGVTKSYIKKNEKLLKEESDMKLKLQTEVTKIKEKLENHLSKINELIRINEKIEKGIKVLGKEKEKIQLKLYLMFLKLIKIKKK